MRITGTECKQYEIEIGKKQQFKIIEDVVLDFLGIKNFDYIEDGKIMRDTEIYCGSHSYIETASIRDATEEDLLLIKVLDILKPKLLGAKS